MVEITLTGIEDRKTPWKYLVAGPPGSGKTAFGSTAPNPWFLFFQEEPRLKSIADRSIPHSKIVNTVEDGALVSGVESQMVSVLLRLRATQDYDTLVIDTLDEYQMRLKEERRIRNGGEWGPSDWNWLTDTFRETIQAIIDLPMRIIANVHVKTAQDDDHMYKELLLQGSASDEAPGWFDVVGALDSFEILDDSGNPTTKRVLLTSGSRKYPWVKDHSFQIPKRFELSDNFVGDVERLEKIVTGGVLAKATREIIETIDIRSYLANKNAADGPSKAVSPEELEAKKRETRIGSPEQAASEPEAAVVVDLRPSQEGIRGTVKTPLNVEPEVSSEEGVQFPLTPEVATEDDARAIAGAPDPFEEAEATVEEAIGTVKGNFCAVCADEVDENMSEISKVRYRRVLCRTHYKTAGDVS